MTETEPELEAEQEPEQETDQTTVDEGTPLRSVSLLQRVDLPFLFAALIAGIVALVNDPWWTVKAVGSSSILNVQVSPFYVRIDALGAPATLPYVFALGTTTRIMLGLTAMALAIVAFSPMSVWRKPVFWLGLSSIVEAYLSFTLMLHSAQLTLLNMYGTVPPLSGDTVIPGTVLGLDFSSYFNPRITSSFAPLFLLGLACTALLGGSELFRFILRPREDFMVFDFMKGLSGVFLSPPYQHAWLTSNDQSFNPLNQDPDNLTDDEMAMSFERLQETVRPGGVVSIILPTWAGHLSDRLAKLVPWTGFRLEKSETIYRVPGQPENQLVFRKPAMVQKSLSEPQEAQLPTETLEIAPIVENILPPTDLTTEQPVLEGVEGPPAEEAIEDPVWSQPRLTPLEKTVVRSAVKAVERRGEPVLYRELIDNVYMDLLDREVSFGSVREIETILLDHIGKELVLIEELDETGAMVLRKWWLGDEGAPVKTERAASLRRKLSAAKRRIPKAGKLVKRLRPQRAGYVQKKRSVDDE